MDITGRDPLFDDDEEDPELQNQSEFVASKEFLVYLIDAGAEMLLPFDTKVSYLQSVLEAVEENLKQRIIGRDDKVGICFFNTIQKKNIQEANGVYVWSELKDLSADLIRSFSTLHENFQKEVGSQIHRPAGARENPLYDALWVVQAMLRSGTSKNVAKNVVLFTNNDDPFGDVDASVRQDMRRTTIQRAKDAQDLGIGIDLIPLSRPGEDFNLAIFYSSILKMEVDDEDGAQYLLAAANKFEDLKLKLRKKLYKKRTIRKMKLTMVGGTEIGIRTYALVRPSVPASHVWVDSRNNLPLKTERSFICYDTGALMAEPLKRFEEFQGKKVVMALDELTKIKNVTNVHLQLKGFKPLKCLKDYHNLRPPTFIYPDEEAVQGSYAAFIALHRAMLQQNKFAVAFYGSRASSQLVALVPQEEELADGLQLEPPGMHLIYLPYADDIRPTEKYHICSEASVPRASKEQVEAAAAFINKMKLDSWSVFDISDPAMQRHYAILQAIALEQEEESLLEATDTTLPDSKGIMRATSAVQAFKDAVYGPQHDQEEADAAAERAKGSIASQKRKAAAEVACKEAQNYDWGELADTGKLKDLTVPELKLYLTTHKLPLTGKKELIINRILTHLGK
ncbi:hypothetical protein BDL97_12G020900 [Sphagnum fallax]|nr:hypothetical protein BDL97_12G020900 [Sphagnum fallax]